MKSLNNKDEEFLISFKKGKPKWKKLRLPGVDELPEVKWKLLNLNRMDKNKKKEYTDKLASLLFD